VSQVVDVELIGHIIEDMNKSVAAGLVGRTSEYLKYSHPVLAVLLYELFPAVTSLEALARATRCTYRNAIYTKDPLL
jgi:hypothetical protein